MPFRTNELNRPLFHWSPRERRRSIERLGLVPGKRPTCSSGLTLDGTTWVPDRSWRPNYVCLGPDPWLAAVYSWRIHGEPEQTWDLWEVWLDPAEDKVAWRRREAHEFRHVEHTERGPVETMSTRKRLVEVRIANRIPKRRVEWLAERTLRDVRGNPR